MSRRILYNVNIPRFFYTHRLPLALATQEAGYDVHVTTSDEDRPYVEKIIATGLPYHPLPLAQYGTSITGELRTLQATISLYRKLKPDLIHHVAIKPVLYGGIAARLTRVPAVVSAVSGLGMVFVGDSAKYRLIQRIAYPAFRLALGGQNTRMILQNPDDQQIFIQKRLIPAERTVLIRGSGVDMQAFTPQPEPAGLPIVLYAGRLLWQKGIREFVEAARMLQGVARFVVVGFVDANAPGTVPAEWLQAQADAGAIEWWGKRDDMPQVFARSHVVCLPSSYGEGVPKVLIEAAASGRALVATDVAGCREITQHERNGLLVPPDDLAALAAALRRLIENPAERQRMGAAGRQFAAAQFSLASVLDQTLAVYRQLLDQHSPDNQRTR